ncbi:hypothetical protein F5Y04DRAFT_162784 [Hypomontagnella monticulosa]|nr:hypothetical protein F5Y04DRAFT_162784 [Hypomontagnella monticulosa]
MKFTTGPLFATLALTAYLPSILAVDGLAASKGSVAILSREVANNGTAAANGTEVVDVGQGEENNNEENVDENNEGENANEEENASEENQNQEEQNQDEQNQDEQNQDENANQDENQNNNENNNENNNNNDNIQGNLQQNIEDLMLSLGICNFNFNSINNLGVGNQIQLLLQLQQLAQLQQLGIVNSFSIEQLLRQEILLNNFNLNILKRTVNSSVKQAARENKRTVMTKRECQKNKNN